MHACSSLLISCIDFRIQKTVEDWARKHLGAGEYDRVGWAGGVLKFDEIMGQIDISVRLHGIKKVVLMNHEDCGAYLPAEKRAVPARQSLTLQASAGGSRERIVRAVGERQAKAGGTDKMFEKHRDDLHASRVTLHAKYPDLSVETYYVTLAGDVIPT